MKEGTVSHITNIFQESERLKIVMVLKSFYFSLILSAFWVFIVFRSGRDDY